MSERLHYYKAGGADSEEAERLIIMGPSEDESDKARLLSRSNTRSNDAVSWDDSTEGSEASLSKGEYRSTSVLASEQQQQNQKKKTKKKKFNLRSLASPKTPFLRNFFKTYRSVPDGSVERVTPFAVVLLVVLLAVYVLNQADRLVLPVVIPNGLRCDVGKDECAVANNATNSSASGNGSNETSSEGGCIKFNDDQQGLLTGVCAPYLLVGHCKLKHKSKPIMARVNCLVYILTITLLFRILNNVFFILCTMQCI